MPRHDGQGRPFLRTLNRFGGEVWFLQPYPVVGATGLGGDRRFGRSGPLQERVKLAGLEELAPYGVE
jgi:hypothetical protein